MIPLLSTKITNKFKMLFKPLTFTKAFFIIAVVGFLAFFNMLQGQFIFDDNGLIGPYHPFIGNYFRPLTSIYSNFLNLFFRDSSYFYHSIQLFIHIVNSSLLFLVLRRFLNKEFSLVLSLVFLVHPIQTESVSFISAVSEPLFFLFGIAALYLSMKNNIGRIKSLGIFVILFLSLMSKETGILFIFLVILYKILFKHEQWKVFFLYAVATLLFYCFFRFSIYGGNYLLIDPSVPLGQLSLPGKLLNWPAIFFYYLKALIFPKDLAAEQTWIVREMEFNNFWFPLIFDFLFFTFLFSIGILLRKVDKVKPVFFFFVLWFLMGLGFHLQIIPFDATVADRWFYFPLAGLLGVIGIAISQKYKQSLKFSGLLLCFALILAFSIRTIIRNNDWSDVVKLVTHDTKIHSGWVLEKELGDREGQLSKKIEHYKKSVDSFPREDNLFYLAISYEKMGDLKNAKQYYYKIMGSKALRKNKNKHYLASYARLGRLLLSINSNQEAKNEIQKGLLDYPKSWQLWALLSLTNSKLNYKDGALWTAKRAKSLYPSVYTKGLYEASLNNLSYYLPPSSIFDFSNLNADR